MATDRHAEVTWKGSLLDGRGSIDSVGSGAFAPLDVTWASRTEEPGGLTSPEELIAAAHSSCFSMALSNGLNSAGKPPTRLDTRADVTFQPGTGITGIHLTVQGEVPGIDEASFIAAAEEAKVNCPVSQALSGTTITLTAKLS